MGNLINPVSFRLGSTRFWNSTWSLNSTVNYSFLNMKNILLQTYLEKLFKKITSLYFKDGLLLSSIKFIQTLNFINILIYFKFDQIAELNSNVRKISLKSIKIINKEKLEENIKLENFKSSKYNKNIKKNIIKFSKVDKSLKAKSLLLNYYKFFSKKNKYTKSFLKSSKSPYTIDITTPDVSALFWYNIFNSSTSDVNYKKITYEGVLKIIMNESFRYIIQKYLFQKIKYFLKSNLKNFWSTSNLILDFNFIIHNLSAVTSSAVSRFICIRLKQGFPVRKIVNTLLKQMKRLRQSGSIYGFKITCSGRFARRGRASFIWEDTGKIAQSVLALDVDYTLSLVTLINSICGIKVWIIRNHQPSKNLLI